MWRHKLKDRDVGRFNSATQEYLESWLEKRRISFTPRQVISGTGEQLSLRKVLSNTPLVCLTGGSGFGKSVLAVDAARSIAYTGTPEGKTVLYLDTTQLGPLDIDSPDNLTRWACQYGSVGSKFGTDFIEKRLRSESNTCIIDGIDEVMGIEKRFRLHNWISSLTQAYHSHFCVVSSSAFITDPIRRRFEEFRVAPLDNDSITEILRPELQRNAAYSGLDVQDQINTFWNYLE
ncbi:MAG TPA: NACHT domain-containing protein, partial [Candidatus Nanoarchaeia archaeon]|nr:NACHT domain-containing protein [Candidatus Nanoarchaeia archaeon]